MINMEMPYKNTSTIQIKKKNPQSKKVTHVGNEIKRNKVPRTERKQLWGIEKEHNQREQK